MEDLLRKNVKLNNGIDMPMVGLGTYKMTDPVEGANAIAAAINMGYRMIDTADYYNNQKIVAKGIEKSSKTREDLFITSKIWFTDQAHDDTIKAFNRILKELKTDYLDLVLVHWPSDKGTECYKALEELYNDKKIRAIGVSNYLEDDLKKLISEVDIVPMVDQVELHPLLPMVELQKFATKNKVHLESWRTMLNGEVAKIPYIEELAAKYETTPQAISLKWALQRGIIIIPKSVHEDRIKANATEINKFDLTKEEIQKINELGPETRLGPDPLTYGKEETK
ncbi:aldo/keto reductase [Mesoplasma lactucae]|uniref:Aldo/keto reductase n=1 Tax=Mesoplasma lactucae ATCC 49193 TaxID=81460 RepID=A0A291IRE5_9MOLU|nr:aldo/keto reductase [Mesoplasma lactucae]ATG97261.1 aldo/keto reductase [Mesoplasma lactucae ATCC 49193]ATZ20290.1 aldo/keto reductase [Mesoplasma lactucae ATCC 49193]MCL8216461.1 Glyoxal reductase [Mesoplasma lactucae ATCC 49193]